MPEHPRNPFAYAIVRIVPRIERGERFNVGVVVFCRQRDFLGAKVALDAHRLRTLAPELDPAAVRPLLDAIVKVAAGDPQAGPIATLPASERFGWLIAPSSTVLQPSEAHTGLTEDPAKTLDQLFSALVETTSR